METALPTKSITLKSIKCYNCGREGHIERNCPKDYLKQPARQYRHAWSKRSPVRPISGAKTTKCNTIPGSYDKDDSVAAICAGGYQVEGKVNGVTIKFVVDSGAAITLMRSDIWTAITNNHPKKLSAHNMAGLVGVEGSSLTIHACATVNLHLGNREIETDVVVAGPLITDAILGVDFLQKHGARIDIPSQSLMLTDQGTILLLLHSQQFPLAGNVVSVRIPEKIEVPPTSELEVMAEVEGRQELPGIWLLEEAVKKCPPAAVARALVRVTAGHVPVRLVNVRSKPVTLYKGLKIATIEQVEAECLNEIDCPHQQAAQTVSNTGTCSGLAGTCASKGELTSQFDANVGEDLSEDDRKKFFSLLHKYADIFASSGDDLGRTGKLKHCINTGTAPPIRQPVCRISPQRRDEVRQLIDGMLSKGVIERSTSPWASP